MQVHQRAIVVLGVVALGTPALADYMITQGATAPSYTDRALNFDEVGGPTGNVSPDAWSASHGISELQAGDGNPIVDDHDPTWGGGGGWLGEGNSFFGNFGVFMTLDHKTNAMSMQVWDPSGEGTPFGGGLNIFLFNDGVQVADITGGDPFGEIATPAWGGVGDEWFNLTASDGDVFDEIRIVGFGFSPTTFVDNISWQVAPTPGALALFGLAGLARGRGRRRRL